MDSGVAKKPNFFKVADGDSPVVPNSSLHFSNYGIYFTPLEISTNPNDHPSI